MSNKTAYYTAVDPQTGRRYAKNGNIVEWEPTITTTRGVFSLDAVTEGRLKTEIKGDKKITYIEKKGKEN